MELALLRVDSWSLVKIQVRVISSTSVSRAISGGNGGNGAAMLTMRRAARSSTGDPEDLSTAASITDPSLRTATVMRSAP